MSKGVDPAVTKFKALFSQLKDWTDDDPGCLFDLARQDDSVYDLCFDLAWEVRILKFLERIRPKLFGTSVDPEFTSSWRDFESRFEDVIRTIWTARVTGRWGEGRLTQGASAEMRWRRANDNAGEDAAAIQTAVDFAFEEASKDPSELDEVYRQGILAGADAWSDLTWQAGFDVHGILRRRKLVPFVLFPIHVAAQQASAENAPIYRNLRQAHDAFIFGAPLAALALMRSIMEGVLRDHYGARGDNLSERIQEAHDRLPVGVNVGALHHLRKLTNAVVHLDAATDQSISEMGEAETEREIVSLLFVLRALIEGAPRWQRR